MTQNENEQFVRNVFDETRASFTRFAARFVDAPEKIVEQAATIFDEMIPNMAYLENHDHPMASAVFVCSANLALYLALKERGVDAHAYGRAMLTTMSKAPLPQPQSDPEQPEDQRTLQERLTEFTATAKSSQTNALASEFVYETVFDDQGKFDWGMNVKSCAICFAFAKYDAMDLVPYMCATDDVVSDRAKQGLRRSGTIAVGASHCDFRYKRGGEPQHLAEQYPDRIQSAEDG